MHTPGPWTVMDERPNIVRMSEDANLCGGKKYAACGGGNNEANAKFIAAAPYLFELLKEVHAFSCGLGTFDRPLPLSMRIKIGKTFKDVTS